MLPRRLCTGEGEMGLFYQYKRGRIGSPKVTLRTEFANLHGLRFPDYINGFEFASLMNEAVAHGTGSTDNLLGRRLTC